MTSHTPTDLSDPASDARAVRRCRRSASARAILLLLTLSSCMFTPNTGTQTDKTKPVLFSGGVVTPNAPITIQAYDPQAKTWIDVGTSTSQNFKLQYGTDSLYMWYKWLLLDGKYWAQNQACATLGESALVRSKWSLGFLNAVRGDAAYCYFNHPGAAFLQHCVAPGSPDLRFGALDYRDVGEDCAKTVNRIRAKENRPPLQVYSAGECPADSDAKQNYQHYPHYSQSGDAQNECPDHSTVDGILNTCIWQQMYLDEKKCYQQNPGGCYGDKQCQCGHYVNMVVDTQYTKVACGIYKAPTGALRSVQNFYR